MSVTPPKLRFKYIIPNSIQPSHARTHTSILAFSLQQLSFLCHPPYLMPKSIHNLLATEQFYMISRHL